MKSNNEAKAPVAEQPEKKPGDRRKRDDSLVSDLRELYKPVLDEPIPNEFIEILRRKRSETSKS
jgi:hypothetical protein